MSEEVTEEIYTNLKNMAKEFSSLIQNTLGTHLILTNPTIDGLCSSSIIFDLLSDKKSGVQVSFKKTTRNLQKLKEKKFDNIWLINFKLTKEDIEVLKESNKTIFIINYRMNKEVFSMFNKNEMMHVLSSVSLNLNERFLTSSGLLYFVAKAYKEDYYKYGIQALLGALAEGQIETSNQEFMGFNRFILNELIDANILSLVHGTRIRGRETKPIHLALMHSIDPYFPGLTGNEEACTAFISRIGITMKDQNNEWRKISDLTKKEMQTLNDALISLIVSEGKNVNDISKLIGPIYVLKNEQKETYTRNLDEFLLLIEGAVNLELYGLAFAVLLGNRTYQYNQIVYEIDNYYGESSQIIGEIENNQITLEDRKYFTVIKGLSSPNNYNVLKKLCQSGKFDLDKPIFFLFKKRKYSEIFVYESSVQKIKGYLIYPIFAKLKEEKIIEEISDKDDFFTIKILNDSLDKAYSEIENKMDYHYHGEKQ
ncbi:MAG: hypothetical protein K9W45_07395 [Candidatus Heimdallarchaeum aukensis]|uniref:DHH-CID domain-containing protein n=1 Tax=Candidatus Heimdallarchaeum aukensis TaxID=2876573 RepID=A0A9Y1FK85_9ARCH|nr:MAG: hypothetical protein K9W45_07395 [Candidatus Heimdallarchaeum aukensis]